MAKLEAFHRNFSSSINLFFLKKKVLSQSLKSTFTHCIWWDWAFSSNSSYGICFVRRWFSWLFNAGHECIFPGCHGKFFWYALFSHCDVDCISAFLQLQKIKNFNVKCAKTLYRFSYSKSMANSEAFRCNISSSINILFLKSDNF